MYQSLKFLEPLLLLHFTQAGTRFLHESMPPFDWASTWSKVSRLDLKPQ